MAKSKIYTQEQLQAKAQKEVFPFNKGEKEMLAATDGTFFLPQAKNAALEYARSNGLKVHTVTLDGAEPTEAELKEEADIKAINAVESLPELEKIVDKQEARKAVLKVIKTKTVLLKQAAAKAEKEAAEQAEKEAQEKEAAEKLAQEQAEKEANEKAAKEAAEKAAREVAEKAAAEKEAAEKAAKEQAAKDVAEKTQNETPRIAELTKSEWAALKVDEVEKAVKQITDVEELNTLKEWVDTQGGLKHVDARITELNAE